jgi:Predicted DNA-binding protein with PD1-like DNA-binding motif
MGHMQQIHVTSDSHTLNVEPGEDIMSQLQAYAEREGLQAAHISGLGAASEVELAYYNLDTKEYEHTTITENLEICSLTGNIGVNEGGQKVVHLHGVFAHRDLSTIGGHVVRCLVSGAGEIHLATPPGAINRAHDERTGLTLMCPLHD